MSQCARIGSCAARSAMVALNLWCPSQAVTRRLSSHPTMVFDDAFGVGADAGVSQFGPGASVGERADLSVSPE
jgi:hypothetical protein